MDSFVAHTPPKFITALKDRDTKVLLEQRLAHFVDWLHEKGVRLENGEVVSVSVAAELIKEYVNT